MGRLSPDVKSPRFFGSGEGAQELEAVGAGLRRGLKRRKIFFRGIFVLTCIGALYILLL
jgi:hypothetical protein